MLNPFFLTCKQCGTQRNEVKPAKIKDKNFVPEMVKVYGPNPKGVYVYCEVCDQYGFFPNMSMGKF